MRYVEKLVVATLVVVCMAAVPSARERAVPISVEADVRVTNDIDMAHTESDVAVNPRDGREVVGATTVFASLNGDVYNETYASQDGGYTWRDTTPVAARGVMSGDPRVTFTAHGTALFVQLDLSSRRTEVYRSADGGLRWSGPASFALVDHELVAVDESQGRDRGRIYIAGEADVPDAHAPPAIGGDRYVYLFVSNDDGKAFHLESRAASGLTHAGDPFNYGGVGVTGLTVLRDGSVALSFSRYAPAVGYQSDYVTISSDGGRTFGKATFVGSIRMYSGPVSTMMRKRFAAIHAGDVSGEGNLFALASDDGNGRFAGRLYAVWPPQPFEHTPLLLSYSADRGRTWSAPRRIGVAGAGNFQPEISVNAAGDVAVTWFGTAGFPDWRRFNEYAAVSRDGGRTFSAPALVSSRPSMPRSAGNLRPVPFYASELGYGFISAYSRWGAGGDYVGLAACPDGAFLAYWPDSRGTEYQIYAARIHATDAPAPPPAATERDVTKDVMLAFDPVKLDMQTGEIDVPIRIRNVSRRALFRPITITFLGLQSAVLEHNLGLIAPGTRILNATNGNPGPGARFDYSDALGSYGALPPGGVSEPVVWRFRVSDVDDLAPISLHVRVTART
ncbi:MAG: sialidase family protein [Candidatus Tyrphobacter sp.]